MYPNRLKVVFVFAAIVLASCSSEPAKTTEAKSDASAAKQVPAGPPQPVAAKTAFWEMYKPAYTWASDIQTISLKSGEVAGVKNADGKAGVWTAVFGSPSKGQMRSYVYAVAEQLPDITKGIKAEFAEPWGGPTAAVMPVQTSDFTVDSDAAYKTAADKAAEWLKQKDNAEKPVSLSLGAATRFPAPVWAVMFGDKKAGYLALINASTGASITK